MKTIFLTIVAVWMTALTATATCTFTNANVVYVSPNGNDSTAIPGCVDQPYLNPDVANMHAANGWSLIFLPGTYNLTNSILLWNQETVIIGSAASIFNWNTSNALFWVTNNVTVVLDGTITDAYAPGNPVLEQIPIGNVDTNGVATNVLVTGHGSIYGASECVSFETTNSCSGRVENLHLFAYHSPINFCNGGHTFTVDGVTATVLYSTNWLTSTYNQAIYSFPASGSYNNLLIKNCILTALETSSYCIFNESAFNDVAGRLQSQFTLINNSMYRGDGSQTVIKLDSRFNTVPFYAPFGSLSPINITTPIYSNGFFGYVPKSSIQFTLPYAVLPQVTNNFTFPSLGFSNMLFFNSNGVPTIAWSTSGSTNITYSAPLQLGPISTNSPGTL